MGRIGVRVSRADLIGILSVWLCCVIGSSFAAVPVPALPVAVNRDAAPFAEGLAGEDRDPSKFFVITAVFNPASFQKRYELYRAFEEHMKETGAQLMTIEAIFPALNQTEFQVTKADNPLHIQVVSDDVYWIKESLINIAVSRLPPEAKFIAWIDADIKFQNRGWVRNTIDALHKYLVVQVFDTANFLGPDGAVLRTDRSFGYTAVYGRSNWYAHPGYGWATTRRAFDAMGGLPDYDILGSNDLHFAYSLVNATSSAVQLGLRQPFLGYVVNRAMELHRSLDTLSTATPRLMDVVGYVPGTIDHAWHGSYADRKYLERWKILNAHHFDFEVDMRRSETTSLLEFNPSADAETETERSSSLQADILAYFQGRNEDSMELGDEKSAAAEEHELELQMLDGQKGGHGHSTGGHNQPSYSCSYSYGLASYSYSCSYSLGLRLAFPFVRSRPLSSYGYSYSYGYSCGHSCGVSYSSGSGWGPQHGHGSRPPPPPQHGGGWGGPPPPPPFQGGSGPAPAHHGSGSAPSPAHHGSGSGSGPPPPEGFEVGPLSPSGPPQSGHSEPHPLQSGPSGNVEGSGPPGPSGPPPPPSSSSSSGKPPATASGRPYPGMGPRPRPPHPSSSGGKRPRPPPKDEDKEKIQRPLGPTLVAEPGQNLDVVIDIN